MYHGMILECHGEKYRGKRGKGFIRLVQHQRGSQDGRSRIGSLLETFPLKKKKKETFPASSSFPPTFISITVLCIYQCTLRNIVKLVYTFMSASLKYSLGFSLSLNPLI